jgi:CubicO group peptidase (beta-lactamase class C family)
VAANTRRPPAAVSQSGSDAATGTGGIGSTEPDGALRAQQVLERLYGLQTPLPEQPVPQRVARRYASWRQAWQITFTDTRQILSPQYALNAIFSCPGHETD